MYITDIRLWKDTGYTEGSIQIPGLSDTLPQYDIRIHDDITLSKDRMFSEVKVREAYDDIYFSSYIRLTYKMSDSDEFIIYGWVDDVVPVSDSDIPVTSIRWHIDYWRTYSNLVTYGSGLVRRRPSSLPYPSQNLPYIYRYADSTRIELTPKDQGLWWMVVNVNEEVNDSKAVYQAMYVIPLDKEMNTYTLKTVNASVELPWGDAIANTDQSGTGINTYTVLLGLWDEQLQLDPERITNAFITPFAPFDVYRDGNTIYGRNCTLVGETVKAFRVTNYNNLLIHHIDIPSVQTSDLYTYIATGFDGEVIHSMPFGISTGPVSARLVVSATSAYIQIRMNEDSNILAHCDGQCITVPCPSLDVSANSWSSYNYSGARDRDHAQAYMGDIRSALESPVSSLANMPLNQMEYGTNTASLMKMAAAYPSGWKPNQGPVPYYKMLTEDFSRMTQLTSLAGGLGSFMLNAGSSAVMNHINDTAHARQADGLLIAGGSLDIIFNGDVICLRRLSMDAYSSELYDEYISLYGVTVQEPTSDCTTLIHTGGPLLIDNLEVTGSVPAQAKAFIRDMFRQGVILK